MFDVFLVNGKQERLIHAHKTAATKQKIPSGEIVEAVNSINSFSFEILPGNVGYDYLNAYTTLVKVYNHNKQRFEFVGRVLQITPTMDSDGTIYKEVACEDRLAYLQDSVQPFRAERYYEGDSSRNGLEEFIDVLLERHNASVEAEKRIYRGTVTVKSFESTDGVYKGLNWETTYDCIMKKLVDSFGGYIVLRETDGVLYLDYLAEVGETRTTTIELARNMVSASKEVDPTGIVTRLIPLGAKLNNTEERLTIESVNDGKNYIDAEIYLETYGIKYATVTFDDVTDASNLLKKGREYLAEINGLAVSHDVEALDLSLIGLAIDDFRLYDRYPVKNAALGIDDTLQIVKKTTNVVVPHESSFEMGDTVKRLSDAIISDKVQMEGLPQQIINQVNQSMQQTTTTIYTYIDSSFSTFQLDPEVIWAAVQDKTVGRSQYEEFSRIVRNILQMDADGTTMIFQTIDEAIKEVAGIESSHYSELLTYIRFTANGVEIGKDGSAITMRLDNDSLDFYNNGMKVAYISDNMLYITNARFLEAVRIGNYGFVPEANGSVSFTFLGGGG